MQPFQPLNPLEAVLQKAQAGEIPLPTFLQLLWGADLFVPSEQEILLDKQPFRPLFVPGKEAQMVVVFTAIERAAGVQKSAPHCLRIPAREFLPRTPQGLGIAINPGLPVGLEITPAGLRTMIKEFSALH